MYNQSGYPPPYSDDTSKPPGAGYPKGQGPNPLPSVDFQPGPGPYPPTNQGGYPPAQGGYPLGQGGYPPNSEGPPSQGGYAPPQGYPPAGGYTPPVSQQPMAGGQPQPNEGGWMTLPTGPTMNCPPGLEYLATVDQLLVHQKVELLEALTGFETKNKFTVKNSLGQKVYFAMEESDCCARICCGPIRPFGMKILDNYQNEVIHLDRPLACGPCCFPCCLQKMEVFSPPGCLIGSVEQEWSLCAPSFSIKNSAGDTMLLIEGPVCTVSCCGDVKFKVLSKDGQTVGRIYKQWTGLLREALTDADHFGITFPIDLDVRMKAVMLGACFLIDAMFFERSGNQ